MGTPTPSSPSAKARLAARLSRRAGEAGGDEAVANALATLARARLLLAERAAAPVTAPKGLRPRKATSTDRAERLWVGECRVREAAEVLRKAGVVAREEGPRERPARVGAPPTLAVEEEVPYRAAVVRDVCDELALGPEGYSRSADEANFKLWYRKERDNLTHSFFIRAWLDAPLPHLLSVCREVDLLPTWNKFVTASRLADVPCLFSVLCVITVWLPWPFSSRLVQMHAWASELEAEKAFLVVLETPSEADRPELVRRECKHVAVTLHRSVLRLEPVTRGSTRATLVVHVDPAIASPPEWLITFVLRVFAPWIFNAVVQLLKTFAKPASPFMERIAGNRDLYGFVEDRVKAMLCRSTARA